MLHISHQKQSKNETMLNRTTIQQQCSCVASINFKIISKCNTWCWQMCNRFPLLLQIYLYFVYCTQPTVLCVFSFSHFIIFSFPQTHHTRHQYWNRFELVDIGRMTFKSSNLTEILSACDSRKLCLQNALEIFQNWIFLQNFICGTCNMRNSESCVYETICLLCCVLYCFFLFVWLLALPFNLCVQHLLILHTNFKI